LVTVESCDILKGRGVEDIKQELVHSLSRVYYFYAHGTKKLHSKIVSLSDSKGGKPKSQGTLKKKIAANKKFGSSLSKGPVPKHTSKKRFQAPINISINDTQLRNEKTMEDEYLDKAKSSFPLYFKFTSNYNNKTKISYMQGGIFYYPFEKGAETLPTPPNDTIDMSLSSCGVQYYW
jgi:hypothetical protein